MILYMDRYHGGDMLFLQAFVRALAARNEKAPLLVFHGAGDSVERLFEQEGRLVVRKEGRVAPADATERVLLERAMRETARKLTAMLTDAVVHSVALVGCDRRLLRTAADGSVEVGQADWLQDLLSKQVVPVVAGLTRREGSGVVEEVDTARALATLAERVSPDGVAFFVKGGRLPEDIGSEGGRMPLARLKEANLLPESHIATRLLASGITVCVVTPALLHTHVPASWPQLERQ